MAPGILNRLAAFLNLTYRLTDDDDPSDAYLETYLRLPRSMVIRRTRVLCLMNADSCLRMIVARLTVEKWGARARKVLAVPQDHVKRLKIGNQVNLIRIKLLVYRLVQTVFAFTIERPRP